MKLPKGASFAATVVLFLAAVSLVASISPGRLWAQTTSASDYLVPFPPYHVIDNVYFVGSKGLGIYLITTPAGDILINAGLEGNVPMIQKSVEQLGFRFKDIKILLISHAHFDHDAGAAKIKELTGAKYMVMDADVGWWSLAARKISFTDRRRPIFIQRRKWTACCMTAIRWGLGIPC